MKVCVFGLGEAGSHFARDMARAGADVVAYDPAPVDTPAGVGRSPHPALAARGAEMVLALTPEIDAKLAMLQAIQVIDSGTLYADLSTSAPSTKVELQQVATMRSIEFADVALMAMVPGHGVGTPSLAAGPGATRYAKAIRALGGHAQVVAGAAGTAAGRKLLRSVMMKGIASVVLESVLAADAAGDLPWLWENLVDELSGADETWLRRLVTGTEIHYSRRTEEMASASDLLRQLGVDPTMTDAIVTSLKSVPTVRIPTLP